LASVGGGKQSIDRFNEFIERLHQQNSAYTLEVVETG
jgi:hypothetical protein